MTIVATSWLGMKFVILVVCHHIVDFVLAFAYMKPWCAYHILQYACPVVKQIWFKKKIHQIVVFANNFACETTILYFSNFVVLCMLGLMGLGV
jgi:hypothetical protein